MHILIVLVVLALGGGTTYMAESSVPGDVLYGVKTSVNEEVRGLLAVGAEADAAWEAELAVRRLDEAAELEKRGELYVETSEKLNAEFNQHAEAALKAAANIGSSGQDGVSFESEIRARINAVLEQHAALYAPRDAAGQASGKRTFTLPHVLEFEYDVKAPRDVATGQSSGKINVNSGDVNGDGAVEATTGTNVEGSGAANDSDTDASASGSVELKAGYDIKANKR